VMLVFGMFEFVMPLLGIGLGAATVRAIGLHTNVVGPVLLIALGLLTVIGGVRNRRQDEKLAQYVTRWRGLVCLALGLSVDNAEFRGRRVPGTPYRTLKRRQNKVKLNPATGRRVGQSTWKMGTSLRL